MHSVSISGTLTITDHATSDIVTSADVLGPGCVLACIIGLDVGCSVSADAHPECGVASRFIFSDIAVSFFCLLMLLLVSPLLTYGCFATCSALSNM